MLLGWFDYVVCCDCCLFEFITACFVWLFRVVVTLYVGFDYCGVGYCWIVYLIDLCVFIVASLLLSCLFGFGCCLRLLFITYLV